MTVLELHQIAIAFLLSLGGGLVTAFIHVYRKKEKREDQIIDFAMRLVGKGDIGDVIENVKRLIIKSA